MLPLHKDAKLAKKTPSSHAGLWYDRFFNGFLPGAKKPDENNKQEKDKWAAEKTNWVNKAADSVGDSEKIKAALDSRQALVDGLGGVTLDMCSEWHFVTGMGNNHPVENGFAWHHTLGVPYLTGAAVKGLVRAWCEVWEDFDDDKIKQWFGGKGEKQAGELIFFDALPSKSVQLKVDIMTPHYGDWYAEGDTIKKVENESKKIPADWHDPNPIHFLVVDKGQSFSFAVAKRAGSSIELSEVTEALTQALQWLGAGAKTAAGYGRFAEDPLVVARRKQEELKQREAEEAERRAEAERLKAVEEARQQAELAERRRQELNAMPEHKRVLVEADEAIEAITPRLSLRNDAYGELRSVVNRVLDCAAKWEAAYCLEATAWVETILDKHGWRHPDFNAKKRKAWEGKMRKKLDALRAK